MKAWAGAVHKSTVRCEREGEVSGWEMYVVDPLHHEGNLDFPAVSSLEVAEGD